jgi:hypothetical protein
MSGAVLLQPMYVFIDVQGQFIFCHVEKSLNLEYIEIEFRLLLSGCVTAIYASIQDSLANEMTWNFPLKLLNFGLYLPPKTTIKSFC